VPDDDLFSILFRTGLGMIAAGLNQERSEEQDRARDRLKRQLEMAHEEAAHKKRAEENWRAFLHPTILDTYPTIIDAKFEDVIQGDLGTSSMN